MSQYRRSTGRGSCPMSRGVRSRTLPAMPYGLRLSLHSPQPTKPVSVLMRTNVHGRQPPSACSVSTRAIFIVILRPISMHRSTGPLPVNLAQTAGRQDWRRRGKISRLVDALASGADTLPSVRDRLAELERYRGSMEAELAQAGSQTALRTPSVLQATVDALIDTLRHFPEVLEAGEAEERKAVVRFFLQEIRIEKTTRQAALALQPPAP